jgi:hypothetical protein
MRVQHKIMCLSFVIILISLLLFTIHNVDASQLVRRGSQILYEESLRVNQATDRLQSQIPTLRSFEDALVNFDGESENLVTTLRLGAENITNTRVTVTEEEATKAQIERGYHVRKISKLTKDVVNVWDTADLRGNRAIILHKLRQQKQANRQFAQAVIAATLEKHKKQLDDWHIETQLAYDQAIKIFSESTNLKTLDVEFKGGTRAGATSPPFARPTAASLSPQAAAASRKALSKRGSPTTEPLKLSSSKLELISQSESVNSPPPKLESPKQQQPLPSLTTSSPLSSKSDRPPPEPSLDAVCNYTSIFPYYDVLACYDSLTQHENGKDCILNSTVTFCSSGKAQIGGLSLAQKSISIKVRYFIITNALYEIMSACREVDKRTGGTLHFYGGMTFAL